jgi:predicted Zn-dependent protease
MLSRLERDAVQAMPAADFCSVRFVQEDSEHIKVRRGVLEPVQVSTDLGAMVTVVHDGGLGYCATSDLSESGLKNAFLRAKEWAQETGGIGVYDYSKIEMPKPTTDYETPISEPWEGVSLAQKIEALQSAASKLKNHDAIVDWEAALWRIRQETFYVTSAGGKANQTLHLLAPNLRATANRGSDTQTRSFGLYGEAQQGGMEVLSRIQFGNRCTELADQAGELLDAKDCPTGDMDLLLAPDQMMLQIHESIGHPLELDRILGDERNYAGTSFVTLDMFGKYEYGSDLLNVTYDPTRSEQFATYAFDDEGLPSEKAFIIENGILKRPLGSATSQARADMDGVANGRASGWNRPPIDRMANLNVEAGNTKLEDLISEIETGVLMHTNRSWSIDDSRNKFQFGCEWGQMIENGELTHVVKNPNYRGISATFWRSLSGVGDGDTFEVLGTPFCGKGEPNQLIRVGHASPMCRFSNVEVFGGA